MLLMLLSMEGIDFDIEKLKDLVEIGGDHLLRKVIRDNDVESSKKSSELQKDINAKD